MKTILILLFPLLSFSQTWNFQIHSQGCLIIQNCTTASALWSFNFVGCAQQDFNGSTLELHLFFSGPDGGNLGSNGIVIDITSGNVPVNFLFGGQITDAYIMDPENLGPKCCGNNWYEMGALNSVPCVALPIQLQSIAIRNNALVWQTSMEQNTDFFEVQGAISGGEWQNIGKVKAAGNSNIQTSYSFQLPANELEAGFTHPRIWMLAALIVLGAITLLDKRVAVIACIAVVSCTKSLPVKQAARMAYFRIIEYDVGNPSPVWHSETVAVK